MIKIYKNGQWKDVDSSGGGEPAQYVKKGTVSGNTLTLTNKDDTTTVFTPTGSGNVDDVKVNGTSVVTDKVANIDLTSYATKTELDGKVSKLGNVTDPTDPGVGFPYWINYKLDFSMDADKGTVSYSGINLDNSAQKHTFTKDIPSATLTTAGLMSASDKSKLGNAQSQVKYSETEPADPKDGDIWLY